MIIKICFTAGTMKGFAMEMISIFCGVRADDLHYSTKIAIEYDCYRDIVGI